MICNVISDKNDRKRRSHTEHSLTNVQLNHIRFSYFESLGRMWILNLKHVSSVIMLICRCRGAILAHEGQISAPKTCAFKIKIDMRTILLWSVDKKKEKKYKSLTNWLWKESPLKEKVFKKCWTTKKSKTTTKWWRSVAQVQNVITEADASRNTFLIGLCQSTFSRNSMAVSKCLYLHITP